MVRRTLEGGVNKAIGSMTDTAGGAKGTMGMANSHDEQRRVREELVRRHIALEMAGDAEGVVATFARPRYDLVVTETVLEGAEAVAQRVLDLAAAMPGATMEIASLRHADDAVIVETVTRGRHHGPLAGLPPTGKPFTTRGIAIFRFEGCDLVDEIVYYDRLTLIEQLQAG